MPIYVATAGPLNAKKTGRFADGIDHGRGGRREAPGCSGRTTTAGRREAGKDRHERAEDPADPHLAGRTRTRKPSEIAIKEWPNGGMAFPKQDIRNPEDFAAMAKLVRPEHFVNRVLMTQRP